jgi:hypothetical protein
LVWTTAEAAPAAVVHAPATHLGRAQTFRSAPAGFLSHGREDRVESEDERDQRDGVHAQAAVLAVDHRIPPGYDGRPHMLDDAKVEPTLAGRRRVRRIFLDPGHDGALGLLLLIPAETGVIFGHQAGGLRCDQHALEGFVVPLAGAGEAKAFADWFAERVPGWWSTTDEWTERDCDELDALLGNIVSYGEGDARQRLSLDRTRLTETSEAWIPVHTALGPGYLIFENSD